MNDIRQGRRCTELADMKQVLETARTIAVVGISDKANRASHSVAQYLQRYYRIIPVNPGLSTVLGEICYPTLEAIPEAVEIDIVNVFRRPEHVVPIAESAGQRGVDCLWLQLGIVNETAEALAIKHGVSVVMDACIAVIHRQALSV